MKKIRIRKGHIGQFDVVETMKALREEAYAGSIEGVLFQEKMLKHLIEEYTQHHLAEMARSQGEKS